MPTLEEVKLYLRIDSDDEDSLITSLMETAKEMVEGILRKNLTEFSPIPEPIKQAIMYAISTLFESRQVDRSYGIIMHDLTDTIRRLLFAYREEKY